MAGTPSLVFISGGVRSGKSSFAEKTAISLFNRLGGKLHYIATGVASDVEMEKRITRHQLERENGENSWKTWEQPLEIGELAPFFTKDDILLLDCLTTLLNNEVFRQEADLDEAFIRTAEANILNGIEALRSSCKTLLVVSNEVFYGSMGDHDLVLTYSRILGRLHQNIVRKCDQAYLVEAGIPVLMKETKKYPGENTYS